MIAVQRHVPSDADRQDGHLQVRLTAVAANGRDQRFVQRNVMLSGSQGGTVGRETKGSTRCSLVRPEVDDQLKSDRHGPSARKAPQSTADPPQLLVVRRTSGGVPTPNWS